MAPVFFVECKVDGMKIEVGVLYLRFLYAFQTTLVILRHSYYTETYSNYLTSQRIHYADH